jgi:hypothetical protein
LGSGGEDQQNGGDGDHGRDHRLAARRHQERQQGERRQHQVLKAERAVLPFVVAIGAEGEVVGRAPGERLAEAEVLEIGLGVELGRVELVVAEGEERIAGLDPGDGVGRRGGEQEESRGRVPSGRRSACGAATLPRRRRRGRARGGRWRRTWCHGGAAEGGRQVEEAAFAGLAEAPERGHHAQQKGGQQILHEERAGDQLDHRRGGEEGHQEPRHAGRNRAADGGVEQAEQHQEEGEVEQARGHLAAQQIDDGVGEIGAHGHDGPEETSGVEGHGVVGRDVGGNGQVHGKAVGAGLGLEHGEPMSGQHEEERGEAEALAPGAQLEGRGGAEDGGEFAADGRSIRQDGEGQDQGVDPRVIDGAGGRRRA